MIPAKVDNNGKTRIQPRIMHGDLITTYVEWMRFRGLAPGLINRRSAFLRAAEHQLGKPLTQASSNDITRCLGVLRRRGHADATIYVYAGHLRTFYNWALSQRRVRTNPVLGAAVPRRPRYLPRPIDNGSLQLAVETADGRTRIILLLAALAGLRAVEIARLTREDVVDHGDDPVLLVHGKGDKPRVVPLSAPLVVELRRYGLPRRGPVVRRLDGMRGRVSPSLVSSVANRHLHEVGIPDTLHSLRHFAGTMLYRDTKDIRLVQDVLGHASPAQTSIYTAWVQQDAPAALERLAARVIPPTPLVVVKGAPA